MYNVVNSSRNKAINAAKSGVLASDLFNMSNNIIKKNFGAGMIHSLGHGLGVLVHDYPEGIHGKSNFHLKKNMCITIEPGYYKEGFGGVRIEDDIVVRNRKPALLSKAPDELIAI
jgi:Xaa-Pro aminopeptidase